MDYRYITFEYITQDGRQDWDQYVVCRINTSEYYSINNKLDVIRWLHGYIKAQHDRGSRYDIEKVTKIVAITESM